MYGGVAALLLTGLLKTLSSSTSVCSMALAGGGGRRGERWLSCAVPLLHNWIGGEGAGGETADACGRVEGVGGVSLHGVDWERETQH